MESLVRILLWGWILLEPGLGSASLPEITDQTFIDQCVREHNMARTSVNPPASDMLYMTWDAGLAVTARAWARRCEFKHNIFLEDVRRVHPTFSSVGENIWTSYAPSTFDVRRPINASWVNEKRLYNYKDNSCSRICGHYTQVVWANSYKVGCAVHLCPSGVQGFSDKKSVLFVCNYASAGNIYGGRPYTSGEPCSGCKGSCEQNLCRDQERDAQRSYNWSPDWDGSGGSSSAAAGSIYVVLVTRPVGLIGTFMAALAVHYFYPQVFIYE